MCGVRVWWGGGGRGGRLGSNGEAEGAAVGRRGLMRHSAQPDGEFDR